MKLDKADMPKIIVLGVLFAILIGYGVYSVVGRKASAAPTPPSVREAAAANHAAPAQAEPEPVKPPEQEVRVAVLPPTEPPKKDPFLPCITPELPNANVPPPMLPRVRNLASLPPFRPSGSSLAFGVKPSGGIPPFMGAAPEADPQFVLTGVINGTTNVAIIRAGDSERHIVRVGQMIDGKYLVSSIGRDRVVLTHGTRSIDLRLGGGTNGS
jgi:hypothetical protein